MKRVEANGQQFGHIVNGPENGWSRRKAVCGKNPFPERWYVPYIPTKNLCPTCWKGSVT